MKMGRHGRVRRSLGEGGGRPSLEKRTSANDLEGARSLGAALADESYAENL
jgi:hypothetical protein